MSLWGIITDDDDDVDYNGKAEYVRIWPLMVMAMVAIEMERILIPSYIGDEL